MAFAPTPSPSQGLDWRGRHRLEFSTWNRAPNLGRIPENLATPQNVLVCRHPPPPNGHRPKKSITHSDRQPRAAKRRNSLAQRSCRPGEEGGPNGQSQKTPDRPTTGCVTPRKRVDAGQTNRRGEQSCKSKPAIYALGRSKARKPSAASLSTSGFSKARLEPYLGLGQSRPTRILSGVAISREGYTLRPVGRLLFGTRGSLRTFQTAQIRRRNLRVISRRRGVVRRR